jgi:hypothetical protein
MYCKSGAKLRSNKSKFEKTNDATHQNNMKYLYRLEFSNDFFIYKGIVIKILNRIKYTKVEYNSRRKELFIKSTPKFIPVNPSIGNPQPDKLRKHNISKHDFILVHWGILVPW